MSVRAEMTHIKDNLYLDADERQFILREYKGDAKDGSENFSTLGYFRYPHEALDKTVQHYIKKDIKKGAELNEIAETLKELREYFRKKFNEV